jgi:hypothetical protein
MKRIKSVVSAWWYGLPPGAAPPPDFAVPFRVPEQETLVEVLRSPSRPMRVGITRDGKGIYRIYTEWWGEDWDLIGRAEWTGGGSHDGSFADSVDRARNLATERLGIEPREE